MAAEFAAQGHLSLPVNGRISRVRGLTHCECGGKVEFGTDTIGRSLQRCAGCNRTWPLWAHNGTEEDA